MTTSNMLILFGIFTFGYFLGSIPCGLLLARYFGFGDIRLKGSGNIGAANVIERRQRAKQLRIGVGRLVVDRL